MALPDSPSRSSSGSSCPEGLTARGLWYRADGQRQGDGTGNPYSGISWFPHCSCRRAQLFCPVLRQRIMVPTGHGVSQGEVLSGESLCPENAGNDK